MSKSICDHYELAGVKTDLGHCAKLDCYVVCCGNPSKCCDPEVERPWSE